MALTQEPITTIFDADNHYWETSDAFTRHRAPKFAERGVRLVDIDGNGKPRYMLDGGRLHPILPGPGDVFKRPRPGSLYDYFAGKSDKGRLGSELSSEEPADHPEWFDRDARLACMDEQGVEAAWLFPSQAVCMEGPMQPDIEAAIHILGRVQPVARRGLGFRIQGSDIRCALLDRSPISTRPSHSSSGAWTAVRGSCRSAMGPSSRPRAQGHPPIRRSTRSGRVWPKPASWSLRTRASRTATSG